MWRTVLDVPVMIVASCLFPARLRAPFLALLAVTIAACSPGERGVVLGRPDAPIVSLSEGQCETTCPVYDMTLRPDGSYTLNAVKFVKTPGLSEGALKPEAWTAAEAALSKSGFWTMAVDQTASALQNCQTGAPIVSVTWRLTDGKEKTVRYDAGCAVPKTQRLVSELRAALGFDDLIWTDQRFEYGSPE
jgi:hypothetical protein